MVAGGVGEQVHPLLGDLHVVAVAEVLAHELLEPGDAVDGRRHAPIMPHAEAARGCLRMDGIVGVVLAAGRGTRLRPLTRLRPKALCPVGNVPLVDLALERVRPAVEAVAVNLHHGRRALDLHLADDVHRSIEADAAPRHGRCARSPPAVDRRSRHARRQRRRLVPRLAGALRRGLGRRADPPARPRRRRAAARQRHRRCADAVVRRRRARGGAVGPLRGLVAAEPQRRAGVEVVRHDGPVRRLRHAAGSTWPPTCWPAAARAWWSRARWSRASSTAAWCGATPASTPGECAVLLHPRARAASPCSR